MDNNNLIRAICTMVNSINNQNALKRIYNLTFYLICREDMGGKDKWNHKQKKQQKKSQ